MSKLEIMQAARDLSDEDLIFLSAYLKHLSRAETPAYRQRLTRLNEEFGNGRKFSLDQVERLHRNLDQEGL